MTPAQFIAAGTALHGQHWLSPFARQLGRSDRMVARYRDGEYPIPDDVERDVVLLA